MDIQTTIKANWPAPSQVHAFTTTLAAGNMAAHVPGDVSDVASNRQDIINAHGIPTPITWLQQVHSNKAIPLPTEATEPCADACYTSQTQVACAVMTGDCLPLLLCQQDGHEVAAIHAGWRGLKDGVIDNTVSALSCPPEELLVWLGPAIGANVFELGIEVMQDFIEVDANYANAFTLSKPGKCLADIYQLAKLCLQKYGINQVYGGDYCTVSDENTLFSYRRQGAHSGRMASIIWLE